MFDLEQVIVNWRNQMLAAGIQSPVPLEELEIHLREEIEQQMKLGLSGQKAFEISLQQIGQAQPLKTEFKKIGAGNWNRPLAWSAWILFVISFFLPADAYGGWGLQCAWISAGGFFSSGFWRGDWGAIYLTSLTLANLIMIASGFLLPRFSQNMRFVKFWRAFSFLALTLAWSYILQLVMSGDGASLKIGCYVWTASFLPLFLSTLKIRNRKTGFQKAQYV